MDLIFPEAEENGREVKYHTEGSGPNKKIVVGGACYKDDTNESNTYCSVFH